MPFDSQGKFSRLYSWEQDRINDIDIVSDRHDEEDDNFAAGLNECMLRDGRCVMSGNLNMGNFQIKNVANGQADNEAVNRGQLNGVENTLINTIKTLLNSVVPVGTIIPSLQDTNHDNWLLCNGQEISRTAYPELFAIIGSPQFLIRVFSSTVFANFVSSSREYLDTVSTSGIRLLHAVTDNMTAQTRTRDIVLMILPIFTPPI